MKYAHLFWDLFGVPADRWDALPFSDFQWMRAAADDYQRQQDKQMKATGGGR